MTRNDRRVLDAAAYNIERGFAGFVPHGSADWTAVRRLTDAGKLVFVGDGVCVDCEVHAFDQDVPVYAPADSLRFPDAGEGGE